MDRWLVDEIVSERLRLRMATEADSGAKIALLTDPEVREYVGRAMPLEKAQAIVRGRGVDSTWGHFVLADLNSNALLGTLSFDQKRGPWEVSFQLRRDMWGQGLMSEATAAASTCSRASARTASAAGPAGPCRPPVGVHPPALHQ